MYIDFPSVKLSVLCGWAFNGLERYTYVYTFYVVAYNTCIEVRTKHLYSCCCWSPRLGGVCQSCFWHDSDCLVFDFAFGVSHCTRTHRHMRRCEQAVPLRKKSHILILIIHSTMGTMEWWRMPSKQIVLLATTDTENEKTLLWFTFRSLSYFFHYICGSVIHARKKHTHHGTAFALERCKYTTI